MREKIVAGNWKMHGRLEQVRQLLRELANYMHTVSTTANCIVLPPAIYIALARDDLGISKKTSQFALGGQNNYPYDCGAFTGEHSAVMYKDFGCRYMLVGHSERRHLFAESNSLIAKKFHQVKEHGMIPILCIGETFAEKESGHTASVLDQQLLLISEQGKHCFDNAIIAYEPVWAIGTGITASPAEVQTIHAFIREKINVINRADAAKIPIIYGGSVTEKNAGLLLAEPDIDGVLVGGASLDARRFVEIVKCIN